MPTGQLFSHLMVVTNHHYAKYKNSRSFLVLVATVSSQDDILHLY